MDGTKHSGKSCVGHHVLVGAFAAAAGLGATNAVAAIDIFLELEGIKGESVDKQHPGAIDVVAWSWGLNGPTGSDKKSPACSQPLSVDKSVDVASPKLVDGAARNIVYPTAKLFVRKGGEAPFEFLVLNLNNVTVKWLFNGGSESGDVPNERLTLAYTSATFTYRLQKPDGTGVATVTSDAPGSCL